MEIFSKVKATIKLESLEGLLRGKGHTLNSEDRTKASQSGERKKRKADSIETVPHVKLGGLFREEASRIILHAIESCGVSTVSVDEGGIVIEGSLERIADAEKSLRALSFPAIERPKPAGSSRKTNDSAGSLTIANPIEGEGNLKQNKLLESHEENLGKVEGGLHQGECSEQMENWEQTEVSLEQQEANLKQIETNVENFGEYLEELADQDFSDTNIKIGSTQKCNDGNALGEVSIGSTEKSNQDYESTAANDISHKQVKSELKPRARVTVQEKVDALQRILKGENLAAVASAFHVSKRTIGKWQRDSKVLLSVGESEHKLLSVFRHPRRLKPPKGLPPNVELVMVKGESKPQPRCKLCLFQTKQISFMKRHLERMHTEKSVPCDMCEKKFSTNGDLRKHKQMHEILDCTVCGKSIHGKRALQVHMRLHDPDREKLSYKCTDCDKVYASKNGLDVHIKRVHEGIKEFFKCTMCDKIFSQKNTLNEHMNTHLGIKPFHCKICGDSFAYTSSLRTHVTLHDYESNKALCTVCGKEFGSSKRLYLHSLMHKEHRYKCDVCDKTFYQKGSLVRHTRIHTGEKPYACAVCGQPFNDKSILARHMRLHNKRLKRVRFPNREYQQVKGAMSHRFTEKVEYTAGVSVLQNARDGTIVIKTGPNETNTEELLLSAMRSCSSKSSISQTQVMSDENLEKTKMKVCPVEPLPPDLD